ncbi:lytic transglycosylase domain-containing protein [Magnetovibrio sp.]|uniref:lytic transglycosylase domain-containing protein n=1 Tax=Magnetovibrio sp. TaxID=2024836 RepID=UPI002F93AB3F
MPSIRLVLRAMTFAASVAGAVVSMPSVSAAQEAAPELASLPAMQVGQVALPSVLSADDAELYRTIFALQEKGDWAKADREIKKLTDRLLMGHVLAQRYLHPTKYRSKYKELKAWLAEYADHHDAQQIYKLALKRRPANYKYPDKPIIGRGLYQPATSSDAAEGPKRKHLNREQRRRVARLKVTIKSHLRKGHTLAVKKLIETAEVKKLFDDYNMDWARGRLAHGYFMAGRDQWAVEWAEKAASRSGKYQSGLHWTAGLAQWRLGQLDKAAEHFELSAKYDASPWSHSASAFWAARAHLISRRPEKVMALLEQAAEHPRTFYGMLASKLLGREPAFNWDLPPMDGTEVQALLQHNGGRRALALLQIGEDVIAEKEMRQTARLAPRELSRGMLAIAAHTGMAELTMRLDAMLYPNGGGFDGASYPLPSWEPADGFKVDRALIYALVRQESRFNPNAKSGAGARGLMQLMPGTASFVARDRTLRWNKRSELFDPQFNLQLGQKYISLLLSDDKIQGDLFLMAAAWNGGPGNLNKWRRNVDDMDDALFFIESLPSRETRIFIERVLTNLWIYRNRLGQSAPSLDAVASGVWPSYSALGAGQSQQPQEVAANVQN